MFHLQEGEGVGPMSFDNVVYENVEDTENM